MTSKPSVPGPLTSPPSGLKPALRDSKERLVLQWMILPLSRADAFADHSASWDALNAAMFSVHPLLDSRFIVKLLTHFGTGDELLCVGRAGELVRAICIVKRQARRPGIWTNFLPAQAQIGPNLLTSDLDMSSLIAALPSPAVELDLLCNDPLYGDLRSLSSSALRSEPHALTMNVSLAGSFEDYWAQRPHKLVQNLRRYAKRLTSEGLPVRFERIDEAQKFSDAVARFALLESSGWKGREGTAVTADGVQGRFYSEVMQTFGPGDTHGQAAVYELWLGDQLIASRLLLERQGMVVMLKAAYHEAFDRFAPGRLLLMRVLEDLFKRHHHGVVEFYTDAGADLLAWSSTSRWINHISLYGNKRAAMLMGLARRPYRVARRLYAHQRPDRRQAILAGDGAQIAVFTHPSEMPADAKALLGQAETQYIELGADWYSNLIDSVYASKAGVALYVLRRHHHIVAILPTVTKLDDGKPELSSLSNYYTAIYAPIFADGLIAEELVPLLNAMRQRNKGTPVYRFAPMDPDTAEFRLLKEGLRMAGLRPFSYYGFGNWYLQVNGDWAHYLKERSGQLRSTIKRMSKRFAAECGTLEIISDQAAIERGIAAYQAVYSSSWKTAEPYPEFVPGLIQVCANRGWLRLGLAWLGDKPIAAQFWIVANGRASIYKVAYDEAYKQLAPGTLVSSLLMQHALDVDAVREVDYLIGDDPYKKDWMSHRRERWGLVAYDIRTAAGLLGYGRQHLGQIAKNVRPLLIRFKQFFARRSEVGMTKASVPTKQPPVADAAAVGGPASPKLPATNA